MLTALKEMVQKNFGHKSDNKEIALWNRYKTTKNEAVQERIRNELILKYVYLVTWVVAQYWKNQKISFDLKDDFEGWGYIGLMDAVKKFDPKRGIEFRTYALWRIRGAIQDGTRLNDFVPRSIRTKIKKVKEYSEKHGCSFEEAFLHVGISGDTARAISNEMSGGIICSLEKPFSGNHKMFPDGTGSLYDTVIDSTVRSPLLALLLKDKRRWIMDAICGLFEKEALTIIAYYYWNMTLKEIGDVLEVSESRVSQMHTKSLQKLKGIVPNVQKGMQRFKMPDERLRHCGCLVMKVPDFFCHNFCQGKLGRKCEKANEEQKLQLRIDIGKKIELEIEEAKAEIKTTINKVDATTFCVIHEDVKTMQDMKICKVCYLQYLSFKEFVGVTISIDDFEKFYIIFCKKTGETVINRKNLEEFVRTMKKCLHKLPPKIANLLQSLLKKSGNIETDCIDGIHYKESLINMPDTETLEEVEAVEEFPL